MQTYLNFKAYWDFDTQDRASGMSAWVTLAFSPNPPSHESAPPSILINQRRTIEASPVSALGH